MSRALPRRLLLVAGPHRSRTVCLSFDDGPHPEHTPRLLDVLDEHRVPATFFVIGQNAERYPKLIERIAAEGHDLGNHSYFHREPTETSPQALLEEVRRTAGLLREIIGRSTSLVRPPHGKVTAAKFWALWRAGQTVVLWNRDPKDFACESAETLSAWFQRHPLAAGDLVLLHDNHPYAAEALPAVIRGARERQLAFGTASQWA
jgi:peptidoglycan/xylan/chitin deacetylase (PgdA/CDA1 family)